MSDHDVRDALARYAAATPELDPRAGLPERLARRDRTRRAVVAGVACLAAAVAGTGLAVVSRGDQGTSALVATDDPPSATPTAEPSPTATAEPEPTPSPTAVVPTEPPGPTLTPSHPPTASPAQAPPAPPIVRTARGSDGLTVRMTITPGSVATATSATVRVEASDDDGDPHVIGLVWGDGSHVPVTMAQVLCPSREPGARPAREPHPASIDRTFRHAWRHAGDYVLELTVSSHLVCEQEDSEAEETEIELPFTVTAGEVTSNGPERPVVEFEGSGPAESETERHWKVNARFDDPDGWVGDILVDWGDGSAPKQGWRDGGCEDDDGKRYPMSWGMYSFEESHVYPEPGEYTVTITVTSTGCDGRDPQRATTTGTVVVD